MWIRATSKGKLSGFLIRPDTTRVFSYINRFFFHMGGFRGWGGGGGGRGGYLPSIFICFFFAMVYTCITFGTIPGLKLFPPTSHPRKFFRIRTYSVFSKLRADDSNEIRTLNMGYDRWGNCLSIAWTKTNKQTKKKKQKKKKKQRSNGPVNAHLINPWLSNEQIMMGKCPKCYIPNLMEIGT